MDNLDEISLSTANTNGYPNINKRLWNLKAPLKIKFFSIKPARGCGFNEKDRLAMHKWQGNKNTLLLSQR
jgi:hypothetical protein